MRVPARPLAFLRRAGARVAARKAVDQAWMTKRFLGLRCDLSSRPPIRRAKIEIAMEPRDSSTFEGFTEELKHARGWDHVEVLIRTWFCRDGVRMLYVAHGTDGSPAYAQWLIRPGDQHLVHAHDPERFPKLGPDEVLLEGAYTFARFRRLGAMGDGMAQLLQIAQTEGSAAAITYVEAGNVPSLRGCANVGFVLDHVRRDVRRFGRLRSQFEPPDDWARRQWSDAVRPSS